MKMSVDMSLLNFTTFTIHRIILTAALKQFVIFIKKKSDVYWGIIHHSYIDIISSHGLAQKEMMPYVLCSTYQMTEGRYGSSANPSQFDCGAGVYVEPGQVCDFTGDCPYGEDEAICREYHLKSCSVY